MEMIKTAHRCEDADYVDEDNNAWYYATLENECNEVIDYVSFESEKLCWDFINNYNIK